MCADAASGLARQRTERSNCRYHRREAKGTVPGIPWARLGPLRIGQALVTPWAASLIPVPPPSSEKALLAIIATGRIPRQRLRQRIPQRQTQAGCPPPNPATVLGQPSRLSHRASRQRRQARRLPHYPVRGNRAHAPQWASRPGWHRPASDLACRVHRAESPGGLRQAWSPAPLRSGACAELRPPVRRQSDAR